MENVKGQAKGGEINDILWQEWKMEFFLVENGFRQYVSKEMPGVPVSLLKTDRLMQCKGLFMPP